MSVHIILASSSVIRAELLRRAQLSFDQIPARVDEDSVKESLIAQSESVRDIADALAELKSLKVASRHPDALVLGCDQTLDLGGELISKPKSVDECKEQLGRLSGKRHTLHSAAVLSQGDTSIWRHVGSVQMHMRPLSSAFISDYVSRNWDSVQHSVGGYKLEEEGMRLFTRVQGDFFHVLGLPILELLSFLEHRGEARF